MRYLDFNPWLGTKLHGEERDAVRMKSHHALTREQLDFVIAFAERDDSAPWAQRARFMLLFAYATGLRVSELSRANPGGYQMGRRDHWHGVDVSDKKGRVPKHV